MNFHKLKKLSGDASFRFFFRKKKFKNSSVIVFCIMLYIKYALGRSFILTPLPLLVVFFLIAGIIFLFIGILAQLIINQQMSKGNDLSLIKEKIYYKTK